MKNAVFYLSFKLKEEASVPDFLLAAEKLNNEFISKQKGYVSWKQLNDGETWVDFLTFETMDDINNFQEAANIPDDLAKNYYSFIDVPSYKRHIFSVERSY